jgi:hypothetical protein
MDREGPAVVPFEAAQLAEDDRPALRIAHHSVAEWGSEVGQGGMGRAL